MTGYEQDNKNGKKVQDNEMKKVTGGIGNGPVAGYGQDDETGNEPYIGGGGKPSKPPKK